LSSMAGTVAFFAVGGSLDDWPWVVVACFAAIVVDVLLNVTLVAIGIYLGPRTPMSKIVRGVLLDYPFLFLTTYVGLVPVTLFLADAGYEYGVVGLVAGVVPILMARQVFLLLKRASLANRKTLEQKAVIAQLNDRIAEERRDERARLAMDLHDGALAELYRVHLMGEVLRQDLLHGRLFDLENDVPELTEATTSASDSLRTMIRGLQDS